MTYILLNQNKELVKTGTLKQLIPKCSNPTLLSEEEIKANNVYYLNTTPLSLKPWERQGKESYNYNIEEDKVYIQYEVNEIGLDTFKQNKLNEFKQVHNQIKTEGFTSPTLDIKIDCEDRNLNDFSNALVMLNESGANGLAIVDYEDNVHNLSKADYKVLVLQLGDYVTKLLFDKQKLRNLVNNCTTYEEVDVIVWRTPIYGEDELEVIDWVYNEEVL
ncbi:MAG TPA: hypothetical protein DCL21_00775 [Alphaproteobacteria bacterium]|nr:hypothetical protein [Alphaproteobacteria bacterium]